jgi:hypothetical protein
VQRTPLGPQGQPPIQTQRQQAEPASSAEGTPPYRIIIAAMGVVIVALIIGLLVQGGVGPFAKSTPAAKIPTKWSAVVLSDGEVFFGHMKQVTADHLELVNVFYVQKPSTPSTGTPTSQAPTQILGFVSTQAQCPEDDLSINRSLVLYWEDLQDGSFVAQKLNLDQNQPQTCFQPTPAPSPAH